MDSPAEKIVAAVEAAIANGTSVRSFLNTAREAWLVTLNDKKQKDTRRWDEVIKGTNA